MWKRPEDAASPPSAPPTPGQPPVTTSSAPGLPPRPAGSGSRLGPSLQWEGKLAGDEDLVVEGRFRGEIHLPAHQVTIGGQGLVDGEVRASAIIVEGEVRGNLSAAQQVLVRASGKVLGDIRAPRVALDQGCRFKGAIDMEPKGDREARAAAERVVEAVPVPEPADRVAERTADRPPERPPASERDQRQPQAARR